VTPRGVVALAWIAMSCGQVAEPADERAPAPPEPPRLTDPAAALRGMHTRFDALRELERALLAGRTEAARAHARAIAEAELDVGLVRWSGRIAEVQAAARAVADASTTDEALRREARLAAACAACHVAARAFPAFHAVAPLPSDAPVMAKHLWAVDRLREGMVGVDDGSWRAGLDELARTAAPWTRRDQATLARRLQALADQARATQQTDGLDERAAEYGAMLVVCARCHAISSR
jgi:hypothetical protein